MVVEIAGSPRKTGGADREVEGVVGVDRLLVRGGVVVDDLGVDADRGQRLAQIVAELLRLVEIGRRQQLQREAVAVGAALVAGLVEQRVGLGDVEGVGRHVGGVELRRRSAAPGRSRGLA